MRIHTLLAACVVAATSPGQRLVQDLDGSRGGPADSRPADLSTGTAETWFAAGGPRGRALYRTGGDAASTVRITELYPGPDAAFTDAASHVVGMPWGAAFLAVTPETGAELHVFDRVRVHAFDLHTGPVSGGLRFAERLGDLLLFQASDRNHGAGLYVCDGTVAGTRRLADLSLLPARGFDGSAFVRVGNERWFLADDAAGRAVFATDGRVVRRLFSTVASQPIMSIAPGLLPGTVVLIGFSGSLHEFDGTTVGRSVSLGRPVRRIDVVGPRLVAFSGNVSNRNYLDATDLNTVTPLAGLVARASGSPVRGPGGAVFFTGADMASGDELWSTDGTVAGTARFLDAEPGPRASGSTPVALAPDGRLWFFATTWADGSEFWSTDGTAAGTRVEASAPGTPSRFSASGSELAFAADGTPLAVLDSLQHGIELFAQRAGSWSLVRDLAPGSREVASSPRVEGQAGALAIGRTLPGGRPQSLFLSDGTSAGTRLVGSLPDHPDNRLFGTDRAAVAFEAGSPSGRVTAFPLDGSAPLVLDDAWLPSRHSVLDRGAELVYLRRITTGARLVTTRGDAETTRELGPVVRASVEALVDAGRHGVLLRTSGATDRLELIDPVTQTLRCLDDFAAPNRLGLLGAPVAVGSFVYQAVSDSVGGEDLIVYGLGSNPFSRRFVDVVPGSTAPIELLGFGQGVMVRYQQGWFYVDGSWVRPAAAARDARVVGTTLVSWDRDRLYVTSEQAAAQRLRRAVFPFPIEGVVGELGDHVLVVTESDWSSQSSLLWRLPLSGPLAGGEPEILVSGDFRADDFLLSQGRLLFGMDELYAVDDPGASATVFGETCGTPALRLTPRSGPVLGQLVAFEAVSDPAAHSAAGLLGLPAFTRPGGPPVQTVFGCRVHARPPFLAVPAGSGGFDVRVPVDPSLIGADLAAQMFAVERTGRVRASNGIWIHIDSL